MRVLMVHNWYRSDGPSGENRVVEDESNLLREGGHQVEIHGLHSDDIATLGRIERATLPARVVWSARSKQNLALAIERFRPDVVHLHNTFPLLSPSVLSATAHAGVPVVATLHNYRLVCAGGTLFRDGAVCHDCLGRSSWPGVRHGCYRGSSAMTVPTALSIAMHTRRWQRDVARFVVLSDAQARTFAAAGFPPDRLVVKPNFVRDRPHPARPGTDRHFLYLGRLAAEKGVHVLRRAWSQHAPPGGFRHRLLVAGAGPLEPEVRRWVATDPSVDFLGQRTHQECGMLLDGALAVVVPSVWEETFGLVVVEAKAAGVPAVTSDHASFPDLVADEVDGLMVAPNDPDPLARALARLDGDPSLAGEMGAAARRSYEERYTPEMNLRLLEHLYEQVIAGPVMAPGGSPFGPYSDPEPIASIRRQRSTSAGAGGNEGG